MEIQPKPHYWDSQPRIDGVQQHNSDRNSDIQEEEERYPPNPEEVP
jgi:hypothetical protein